MFASRNLAKIFHFATKLSLVIAFSLIAFIGLITYNTDHVNSQVKYVEPPISSPLKFDLYGGPRIGIILYLPFRDNHYFLVQFVTFIYASWRYIQDFADTVTPPRSRIDLLVFCDPKACPHLPKDCTLLPKYNASEVVDVPMCYFHPQISLGHQDGAVDSFAFVSDHHFTRDIVQRYEWLMRSDMDVFLSPLLLKWIPNKDVVTGEGGYCTMFNRKRLPTIATKYGMKHRGVHCTGSTWYGKSKLIEQIAKLTAKMSMVISNTEFNTTLVSGIELYMNKSVNGEWPDWWKPVSTMYASELVLNHLLPNITQATILKEFLDFPSCSDESVYLHPHIHCWHSDCEFQKFKFIDPVVADLTSFKKVSLFLEYTDLKNPENMTVAQYCTYVARNALYRYSDWFHDLITEKEVKQFIHTDDE